MILALRLINYFWIFQPLVENAIMHGIQQKPDGYIRITGIKENGVVILKIENNGYVIPEKRFAEINDVNKTYFSGHYSYGKKTLGKE